MSEKLTRAQEQKARRLKTTYKQTLEEHEALKASQGGKCAICDRKFGSGKDEYLAFQDHDHKCCPRKLKQYCGKCNRGLLCFICNKKVVAMLERMEKMNISVDRAIAYLKHWGTVLIQRGAYAGKKEKRLRKK